MVERTGSATRLGRSRSTSKSMISMFGPPSPHTANIRSSAGGAEDRLPWPNGWGIELRAARECTKGRPDGRPTNRPPTGRPAGGEARQASGWRPVTADALLGRARVTAIGRMRKVCGKEQDVAHEPRQKRGHVSILPARAELDITSWRNGR